MEVFAKYGTEVSAHINGMYGSIKTLIFVFIGAKEEMARPSSERRDSLWFPYDGAPSRVQRRHEHRDEDGEER